jgi:glycosyltransferase involved in cell wall biosynthesis
MIPDPCIRWFPTALWAGLKLAKQCEVIYSTSAPFTNHLVAWFLRIVSGKPWLADFRDPWTQYVIYQHLSQSRSRIDAVLEHHMLKAADMVSVTCPATAQGFQELYPSLSKDKFVVLTNGYDAEDFTRPVKPSSDRFTIAYTGRFDDRKNTSSFFLEALKDLRSEHPEVVSEIEIIFAGSSGDNIRSLLKQWSLEENIKLIGYVPHLESVELLLKSHILLLTLNDELGVNLTYPGKLFEYLAAQKSILALVPEGATADLIRDMNAGPIIAPYNVSAIKQAILDLYRKYKQSESLAKDYNNLQLFERRTLTRKLAQHLDSMTQG